MPGLGYDGAPGVHDEAVPVAAPLLIVLPSLCCGYHITLGLYCSSSDEGKSLLICDDEHLLPPEERLPVRHPGLDGEGGGEGEQLCPGPREALTEFTEPEICYSMRTQILCNTAVAT